MFIKKSTLILSIFIGLLALAACTPAQPTPLSLDGTQWNLVGFGSPDALTPPVANSSITLGFADGLVSGSAGCNGYGAAYALDGNTIQINTEGFVTTLMFCEPTGVMDQETRFLDWMQKAETVALEGKQLIIHTSEGDLVFEKAQDTVFEGTEWQLSGIVEGDGVVSSIVDEKINLQFADGQVSGSSGCNRYFADTTLDGEKLTLGVIGGTEMACEDEIAQREAAFLAALGQVTGYQIERSSLTLLDASGNALMSFYAGQ